MLGQVKKNMSLIEDLNLKTKIKITNKEYEFELYTIHKGIIKEIIFDNKIYYLTEEIPEDTSKALIILESDEKGIPSEKIKAPNNTAYFLNWLEKRGHAYFSIGDVTKETSLNKEKALKIIQHQISIGNLQQISKWEFAKRKKKS